MVGDFAAFCEHWGDKQVFGASVGGALEDEQVLLTLAGAGNGERCFADAGGAHEPRSERQIAVIDDDPAGKQLFEHFTLADPVTAGGIRGSQMQRNAVDCVSSVHEFGAMFWGGG